MKTGPTIVERILLAADGLGSEGRAFTAEELVVAAWKADPDHFGLQGFADKYPDSNRVLTKIMGEGSTLRQKGWLSKVGAKTYRMTDVGRREALRLRGSEAAAVPTRLAGLGREHLAALRRMLDSTALAKFLGEQPLTFSEVCAFWNISPRSTAHQLARQRALADEAAALALAIAASTGSDTAGIVLPGSDVSASRRDLEALPQLSARIEREFRSEIDVIKRRTDERRA